MEPINYTFPSHPATRSSASRDCAPMVEGWRLCGYPLSLAPRLRRISVSASAAGAAPNVTLKSRPLLRACTRVRVCVGVYMYSACNNGTDFGWGRGRIIVRILPKGNAIWTYISHQQSSMGLVCLCKGATEKKTVEGNGKGSTIQGEPIGINSSFYVTSRYSSSSPIPLLSFRNRR